MVSGQDPEAAAGMAAGFQQAILPGLNVAELVMPGVVIVFAPNFAEWAPTLHLLNATLGAVFFHSLNSQRP